MTSKDPFAFVFLPGLAAFVSGYFVGSNIFLVGSVKYRILKVLGWGLLTTLLAHFLFGFIFLLYLFLTSPEKAALVWAPFSMLMSILLMGVYTFPSGLVASLGLFLFRKRLNV